jgi:hypothetical protein
MKVMVKADHPILKRIDKIFYDQKYDGELNSFLADLEYMGYENIEVIDIVEKKS